MILLSTLWCDSDRQTFNELKMTILDSKYKLIPTCKPEPEILPKK